MPAVGAEVIVMPLKIIRGSGSPSRILARINEDGEQCNMNGSDQLVSRVSPLLFILVIFAQKGFNLF